MPNHGSNPAILSERGGPMMICQECRDTFISVDWTCPACGYSPPISSRIPMFAPELKGDDAGYPQEFFHRICKLEGDSFWFRARSTLIQWAVSRFSPMAESFLEVGCGTGFVLAGLRLHFPMLHLTGGELSNQGLAIASNRLPEANFLQMDARSIPFLSHFDAIGAFDVIEHIQEDELAISEMYKALKPSGTLFLTVPQHPSLWSKVDVFARHMRRYRRRELINKLKYSGFEIVRVTSFVSLLLPLFVASRLSMRFRPNNSRRAAELILPYRIDLILAWIMNLERTLIQIGLSFPLGGSLMVIARRKAEVR